jgi:hypothetical protein
VATINALDTKLNLICVCIKQHEGYPSNTKILNIQFIIVYFNQATCFDPLKGSSSGRGIIKVLQRSEGLLRLPAGVLSVSFTIKLLFFLTILNFERNAAVEVFQRVVRLSCCWEYNVKEDDNGGLVEWY